MDSSLLGQFCQQLAAWIETRMGARRLPFQRLELCPRILTERGRLVPDLVLWINRDSQLAGSVLLLPATVDGQLLDDGIALARALGLGHFTTWAAHEVTIWSCAAETPCRLHTFVLPPANRVTPEDFQRTLDELLERLKVVTVTSTPATTEYSVHYFANLCLRNLQELTPGLTASARMAAGQTAADAWVEHAPREKAWMCLWRILFLLRNGCLPPGLQPERLELAIHYALADLTGGQPSWLDLQENESPLPESDAIRLHHLAGRLRQLGWPGDDRQALELVDLLLCEAGHRFGIEPPPLPWPSAHVVRWVACQPPSPAQPCSLVAPRAYLAGRALRTTWQEHATELSHVETLQGLDTTQQTTSAVAVLHDTQPLDRKEREARLLHLRQVWPSRRFELPRATPAWLWDALYLAGLTSEELSLTLPENWHSVPGIMSLWALMMERFQLAEAIVHDNARQSLRFVETRRVLAGVRIHRYDHAIEIATGLLSGQPPGATQFWLRADARVVELRQSGRLVEITALGTAWPEELAWGLALYLRTQLGGYLWELCSGLPTLPELTALAERVREAGVPVPNATILADLGLLGCMKSMSLPEPDLLSREFANIFGPLPELPESAPNLQGIPCKARRRSSVSLAQVAATVFVDGMPRFPEHYLMNTYRPRLAVYDLRGPLEIATEFFDRISLRTLSQDHTLEVSGRIVAEALILASYSGQTRVALPEDEELLTELVTRYRTDLQRLWDSLARECRRIEPQRLAAVKLARRIWQQQGLPPASALRDG